MDCCLVGMRLFHYWNGGLKKFNYLIENIEIFDFSKDSFFLFDFWMGRSIIQARPYKEHLLGLYLIKRRNAKGSGWIKGEEMRDFRIGEFWKFTVCGNSRNFIGEDGLLSLEKENIVDQWERNVWNFSKNKVKSTLNDFSPEWRKSAFWKLKIVFGE